MVAISVRGIQGNRLDSWLAEHSVYDVLMSRPCGKALHSVSPESTLAECLELYLNHKIHNLLVILDPGGAGCKEEQSFGWLRLSDVFQWVYDTDEDPSGYPSSLTSTRTKITNCLPLIQPCQVISGGTSLVDLLFLWRHTADQVPPLLVSSCSEDGPGSMDTSCELVGVITPADFLHYIYIYGNHLGSLTEEPICKLQWTDEFTILSYRETADVCLEYLLAGGHSGIVGVVDHRGMLALTLTYDFFLPLGRDLDVPVREFVEQNGMTSVETVTCLSQCSFGQVLHKILMNRAHHVWKLNSAGKPIGVVRLSHLIAFVEELAFDNKTPSVQRRRSFG